MSFPCRISRCDELNRPDRGLPVALDTQTGPARRKESARDYRGQ